MEKPIITIHDGKVQGIISEEFEGGKFYKFLGIPYGKAPMGQLRFKAPEPVEKWNGVKDCTVDGPKFIQIEHFGNEVIGSEDALHLNVFTKQFSDTNSHLKPVLVYIFGGKFIFGSNHTSELGPEFLLSEDIVMVVPNFRCGLLGFLRLEDSSLEVPGNAALKDQVLALHWVKKNIKQFGGDPNNVTIAGHSSGAVSVHYHLVSDLSKGLFHKAVFMSGSVVMDVLDRKFDLRKLLDILNIKFGTEKEILESLCNMTAESIIEAQRKYRKLYNVVGMMYGPVVEKPNRNSFLTEDPVERLLNGKFNHVPTLATYSNKERFFCVPSEQIRNKSVSKEILSATTENLIPTMFKEKIDEVSFTKMFSEIEKIYFSNDDLTNITLMLSDNIFIMPLIASAQTQAGLSDSPVYLMRWSVSDVLNYVKAARNCLDIEGCAHGDELGYIFKHENLPIPVKGSNAHTIIKRSKKIITNFCKYGNPSTDFALNWEPLQTGHNLVFDLGREVAVKRCPEEERMRFWQKVLRFDKRNTLLPYLKTV